MLISLLDRASSMDFMGYHPGIVIQVVNALLPLGKLKALEQVDAYLENLHKVRQATGLFWVLRVLFNVPDKRGFPPVNLGAPNIPPPARPELLPRFPIVLVRDIPFLVVRGYFIRGLPEPVEDHVTYFRAYGVLRDQPLAPPATLDGIELEFLKQWNAAYGKAYITPALEMVNSQIARLIGD